MPSLKLSLTDLLPSGLQGDLAALKALEVVAEHWAQLGAGVDGVTSAETLLDAVATDLGSAQLAAAFHALGRDAELATLKGWLGAVTKLTGKVPAKYKDLLRKLSDFPVGASDGKVAWSIKGSAAATPAVAGGAAGYALNVGGAGSVRLDAAFVDGASKLLSIGLTGKVEAGAHGGLPFAYGTISGAVCGSASLALDYRFKVADRSALYAVAVAERLGDLPAPFDLVAVWSRFAASDLDSIVFEFGDTADAKVEVVVDAVRGIGRGVTIQLGGKVGVTASRRDTFRLTLSRASQAGGALAVRASLGRVQGRTSGADTDFGLKVDLSSVTQPVADAIGRIVDDWDDLLKDIKPFLSPGTWLQNQADLKLKELVGELIDDKDLGKAVLTDLEATLGLGTQDDKLALADWLTQQVASAIDRGSTLIDTNLDQAVDRVAQQLTAAAPIVAAQIPADALKAFLKAQVKKAADELEKRITGLYAAQASALKTALKAMGVQSAAVIGNANDALASLREVIQRYDDLVHKILAGVQKAAKQKVTARLYAKTDRGRQADLKIVGDFLQPSASAAKVFETLTRGKLADLEAFVLGGGVAADFVLDKTASKAVRTASFASETGFEVAFVKGLVTVTTVMEGKATIALNAQGDVVVDSDASFKKTLWLPWNEHGVFFTDAYRIVETAKLARAPGGGSALVELGVGSVFEDRLQWKDVASFVGDATRARLLPPDLLPRVQAAFNGWGGGAPVRGDLSLSLRPTADQIGAMLRLAERVKPGGLDETILRDTAKLEIMRIALGAAASGGVIDKARFLAGAAIASTEAFKRPEPDPISAALYFRTLTKGTLHEVHADVPARMAGDLGMPELSGDQEKNYAAFYDGAFSLRAIVAVIDGLGAIHDSIPAAGGQGDWSEDRYVTAQKAILHDARVWLTVFHDFKSLFEGDITPRTLAFMRILVDLTLDHPETAPPGGATLTLTYRPPNASAQTVSFGGGG